MHQTESLPFILPEFQRVELANIAQHDVFVFIARHLKLDDVIVLSIVSRFMNYIQLVMLTKVTNLDMIGVRHPYSRYSTLRNVAMSLECEELDAGLFPNLRRLVIQKGYITGEMKFLRSLDAIFTEISCTGWMLNIVSLRITNCFGCFMDLGLMTNLTYLSSNQDFPYWNAPNLRTLEWINTNFENTQPKDIGMLTKLENLTVECSSMVGLKNLERLTSLGCMYSSAVDYISTNLIDLSICSLDISFSGLSKLTGLTVLENVEDLVFDDELFLSQEIFSLTNLRSLYISIWDDARIVTSLEDLRNQNEYPEIFDGFWDISGEYEYYLTNNYSMSGEDEIHETFDW